MSESLAIQAHKQQNLDELSPENTRFPGHDTFQNGIIPNGQPTTFYTAATNADIENIQNHNSNMSGFLTDADTVNSCKGADGVLDANLYADKTQTQPWRPPDASRDANYSYRENVAAFDVNWDTLNAPENADLKARLCDADGNIKCAYGKTEANTHWGEGGGNQYYINRADFNEGVNRGIFEYTDGKTLKEDDGTLVRNGMSPMEYKAMNADRNDIINSQLSSCSDRNATSDTDKARALNAITPEKADQINSAQAADGNYLAKPDPAYKYPQKENGTTCGEAPPRSAHATIPESPVVCGEPPQPQKDVTGTDNQTRGTTPDQAQGIDLPSPMAESFTGKDLVDDAAKKNNNGFAPNTGIT